MESKVMEVHFLLLTSWKTLNLSYQSQQVLREGTEMPFVILGDEAYPLKTYLMKKGSVM